MRRKLTRMKQAIDDGDTATLERVRKPIGIYGRPGCGKSSIPQQIATEMGFNAVMMFPAQSEPQDVGGFPFPDVSNPDRKIMQMLPTVGMEQIINIAMINACGQLSESRMMNGRKISDYVTFVYTGNTMEYNCGGKPLPDHVTTRQIMYTMETDAMDFVMWGVRSKRIVPDVIAYLRLNHKAIFDWVPEISGQNIAYATSRSWERMSDLIREGEVFENYGKSNECMLDTAEATTFGAIGPAAGATFLAWMVMRKDMPNVHDCINRPGEAELPTNPAVLHTLANTLATMATDENMNAVCEYMERMPRDFQKCFSMDVCAINPKSRNNSSFIAFETALDC